jgi:hypothetical protein
VTAYDDYCAGAARYQQEKPAQRTGQAHFNHLCDTHPALADEAAETLGLDPFHHDDRLPDFLAFVKTRLEAL